MDDFKKETSTSITAWDLDAGCRRSILPHSPSDNQLERKFRRKARRRLKQKLIREKGLPDE